MFNLGPILTWNRWTIATVFSSWQVVGGVIAIALAISYIQFSQIDPGAQETRLKERTKDIDTVWPIVCNDVREAFKAATGQTQHDGEAQVPDDPIPFFVPNLNNVQLSILPRDAIDLASLAADLTVAETEELKAVKEEPEALGVSGHKKPDTAVSTASSGDSRSDGNTGAETEEPKAVKEEPEALGVSGHKKPDTAVSTASSGDSEPDSNPASVENGASEQDGEEQLACEQLSWRNPVPGSFGRPVSDSSDPDAKYRLIISSAKTRWAEFNINDNKDNKVVLYVVEYGTFLRGWRKLATSTIVTAGVIVFLIVSNSLMRYLYARSDRLSELNKRMDFVLHDLRGNLERIRSNNEANAFIRDLADSSNQLIEDGRLIADIQQEPLERVDLHYLLKAAASSVDVEPDCPHGLIVRVPERSFRAAITNLLYNAEEHGSADRDGRIELKVAMRRGRGWIRNKFEATITIADEGSGIENQIGRAVSTREAIENLQNTRDVDQRRGIGLLSVLYVVQECGGQFALLNREDGKTGTVAEIILPVELRKTMRRT